MNLADAEAKLDDHLMKGIVSEVFWADECKAFAVKIGKHSTELNKTAYAQLFGRLQTIMSEHQTMAVTKILRPRQAHQKHSFDSYADRGKCFRLAIERSSRFGNILDKGRTE